MRGCYVKIIPRVDVCPIHQKLPNPPRVTTQDCLVQRSPITRIPFVNVGSVRQKLPDSPLKPIALDCSTQWHLLREVLERSSVIQKCFYRIPFVIGECVTQRCAVTFVQCINVHFILQKLLRLRKGKPVYCHVQWCATCAILCVDVGSMCNSLSIASGCLCAGKWGGVRFFTSRACVVTRGPQKTMPRYGFLLNRDPRQDMNLCVD